MQILSPSKPQFALFSSQSFLKPQPQSFLRIPPRSSLRPLEDPTIDELLVVRRPVKEVTFGEELGSLQESNEDDAARGGEDEDTSLGIESGLNDFAKKMPMFEPLERVGLGPEGRPLGVNLELGLYRAKVLGRKFQFPQAENILRKCIFYWPEDGRAYVAMGKILSKQSRFAEARIVYERGCQATQGENPYIWQCWAVLENRIGNTRRARELFDAATVADNKHVAAWHGWAVLEIKEGNINKARNLLGKGLRYCGANEYIYQTLALLEAKGKRIDQARYLFQRATACNSKSCASWIAWAQLEMEQENHDFVRKLFEKAVQSSPKNRFAWHVWAMFEARQGDTERARKLLKIGHNLNPRDPVLLQSMALLEYKHSSANLARMLFRKASEIDPKHQPIWMAWGWMEWKEGNISTARELYRRALTIDSTTETAARCLQAWGVLEQRLDNLTTARRLFRSSLNINSQSYITWMTWASLEEDQGNALRAEEIRNLYFQQRTEVVDDASWVMGFMDIIDPAVDSIKRLLKMDQGSELKEEVIDKLQGLREGTVAESASSSLSSEEVDDESSCEASSEEFQESKKVECAIAASEFDLDAFVRHKFSIDASELEVSLEMVGSKKSIPFRRTWKPERRTQPVRA